MPSPSSQYAQEVKNGVFLSSHHFYISDFPCFSSVKRRVLISVRRAFVARRMLNEQIRVRTELSSLWLSYWTNAQWTSGRNFLFPLLSLASLLSLSYVFLDNSMFSLAFWTCPPLPTKEKEGWWASKITYKHILLQISHKCIFFNLYLFLYVFIIF